MGDEDILFCLADSLEITMDLAQRYNAYVLDDRNEGGEDYQAFRARSVDAVSNRKCFRADRLDHRSFKTMYYAETTLAGDPLYSVIASHYAHKGLWLKGYVMTFEAVPRP